ncbi:MULTISPECIES: Gfo/Idh/MocA family protein [Sphingomonas]|uniref:Gfo/Idh/MocA family protein n=1 Tax=Sphingomonas TaxID=13687 RepID=UPI000DEF3A5C|nr:MULTISPECIES: Gfo/Idh/MocA family oxidoreductase [Sphingomonas]
MTPHKIAIIGFGKIAADQHVPAIAGNPDFTLAATVDRSGTGPKPNFTSHTDLLAAIHDLDSAAITTPPGPRYEIARDCIAAGLHLLLEKPPCVTLGEIVELAALAKAKGTTLFTSWHAQANPAVTAAADLLKGQRIAEMRITWHEDVHKWHPGQQWVWEAGGFGVFDPGINAFSIATFIFPGALFVRDAVLTVPANAQTPIAVELELGSAAADGPLHCSLDWRKTDGEEWTIAVKTAAGQSVELREGGKRLFVDGQERAAQGPGEYPSLYQHFAALIAAKESLVDTAPLRLVADALLVGRRESSVAVTA